MAYYKNFIVFIQDMENKTLREFGDVVKLPFGTEYKIGLKNLDSRRAVARISIDGISIGNPIVVDPNDKTIVERFVDMQDVGRKFKFIEKTQKISNYRGDREDDGIIRVEFEFEQKFNILPYTIPQYPHEYTKWPTIDYPYDQGPIITFGPHTTCNSDAQDVKYSCDINESMNLQRLKGITVEGSDSNQKFKEISGITTDDNKHVITLMLQGDVNEKITTKTKFKCQTCGTTNSSQHKYCFECGTRLN